ncbi:hypothetical protein BKH42_09085 [Helicobacter sp. 13S00482-2]|uniref:hypothetical protein n=1 Tax=Helicobacter sp. 13S00482-2 TaxID=1476200 RepID=UPI000BA6B62F|nr:hypothetical protein [Helicobacter sp. 13S00482-2]PAF52471.1 hypothetical protein BKH42_09085 [Helicobacter sp. 13S00482-2]
MKGNANEIKTDLNGIKAKAKRNNGGNTKVDGNLYTINGSNVMSNSNGENGKVDGVKTNANGVKVIPIPSNANGNHAKPDDGKLRESRREG